MVVDDRVVASRGAYTHWRRDGRPKVTYRTKRAARAAVRQMLSDYDQEHHAYRCGECSGWHAARGPRRRDPGDD